MIFSRGLGEETPANCWQNPAVSGGSDTRGCKRVRQRNQRFVREAPAQGRLLEKGLISNIFKTIRYLGESGLTPATGWEDCTGS